MTDYRYTNHPGNHNPRNESIRMAQQSNTSVGGILIALALIGLVFLGLSIFFGGTGGGRAQAPLVDQTTSQPVAPTAPSTTGPVTD